MIQIKTLFGEWKEVTKEQAKACIMLRIQNLACKHKQNTVEYINQNILKGIKMQDLISKSELSIATISVIYGE